MWGFRNRTINSHEIQNIRQFFSYFYWGQSAKILQHRKKERFKISETAKLNSSLLQTYGEITPQNHEIFTVVCMAGCKFLPRSMETSLPFYILKQVKPLPFHNHLVIPSSSQSVSKSVADVIVISNSVIWSVRQSVSH